MRYLSAFSTCSIVPALPSALVARCAHAAHGTRTRLCVDDTLAVELGHSEAKAFEHLRAGGQSSRCARRGTKHAPFGSAWSSCTFSELCRVRCCGRRKGLHVQRPLKRKETAHASGPGTGPIVVQLYHARKEVRHNLSHQHCAAHASATATPVPTQQFAPPSLKSRAMFFFGRDNGMSSTCGVARGAPSLCNARETRSVTCVPTGRASGAPAQG